LNLLMKFRTWNPKNRERFFSKSYKTLKVVDFKIKNYIGLDGTR
jgi:hypothetical protein